MKRRFENLTRRAGRAIKHWWLMTIAGVLAVAAGIAVFAFPLESYVALSILFGVLMLVVGAAKEDRERRSGWAGPPPDESRARHSSGAKS